ncbi:MAG: plasmid pRiA4b ORF-3 family protein [Candidatus Hydrogenedentes bacterium]|nr:plasmid pRiA4b ORF-3 family protein [Candidatus Hydrogenedentota bacterium]
MSRVYQLKIMLMGSKPPIWRRITVDSKISLGELQEVIQIVMGWMNYHLHEFIDHNGTTYGTDDMGDLSDELESEDNTCLRDVLYIVKQKLQYIYDFGDGWQHQITLEKIFEVDENEPLPHCLKGKNACPPEDCGGLYGYYELLKVLADPKDERYEEMRDWMEDEFDPKLFDIDAVNKLFE